MSIEQYYSEQAARMILSGIEFIARVSGFLIAVALLIWTGGALWIGYGERRQRRDKRYH